MRTNRPAGKLRGVVAALDRNGDYGQGFGGAETPKFAKQMETMGVPIELTVQIDSVGLGDEEAVGK